jgi:hypothetical protein
MGNTKTLGVVAAMLFMTGILSYAWPAPSPAPQAESQSTPLTKYLGSVKALNGNGFSLTTDAGQQVEINTQAAKLVRIAPGEKDLKNAVGITLQDLQVGDRVLVRGKGSDDSKSLAAVAVVVMKKVDVESKQQHEREDWQKRGIGGLVSAVDASAASVTVTTTVMGVKKSTVIHASKATVIRRYAPDSVKFDDAKLSTLAEIKPGDQVRARGVKNADGTEFAADEIVSGTFRNIAGLVNAVDATASTLTVQDLVTKKPVTVKVGADSQLRRIPPEFAQRIAMRLKGGAPGASGSTGQQASSGTPPAGGPPSGAPASGSAPGMAGPGGQFRSGGGAPDFQQMLARMPAATLADIHKGDALMIVSTEGGASGTVTAITLLAGVEAILAANGGQPMMLSPWSLGGGGGEEGGQ